MDALEIIKTIGARSLGDSDGYCACTHFYIRGVRADVSCKEGEICVSGHYDLDYSKEYLMEIGNLIKEELDNFSNEFVVKVVDFT